MVPLSTFSVVVPSRVPRVLRALFTFWNHKGVRSAFDEQLLGEAMAEDPLSPTGAATGGMRPN
jgi:hypothetical protein